MRCTILDEKVSRLAARQYWLISRAQAYRLGASRRFIDRRVAAGHWVRVEPGVYLLAGHALTWQGRFKAVELGAPGGAIAGLAAAAVHALTDVRPGRPEIVVAPDAHHRHKVAIVHRQVGIRATTVDGVRVTTIAQTLFDLAPRIGLWPLERALDDALVAKRLTVDDLNERLAFYDGSRRPGVPRMRALIGERAADAWVPPASELEALLYRTLDSLPSRPTVVRQEAWPWRTSADGTVDSLLPASKLIVEGDGRRWHTRVADFDRDRWRDNQAAAHGYRVLRYTWLHLTEMVDDVIDLTEEAIRADRAA
ncbi:MAG: type IV toxin-antitoxin system AbiEi family antitoxin domain-containing protein [Acidimicrobiales bacterium]